MHEVGCICALWARWRRSTLLQLLAAVIYWWITTAMAGAQPLQPSAADARTPEPATASADAPQPETSAPCACRSSAWRALERDEPAAAEISTTAPKRKRDGDPAGSRGWEIVGGTLPAVAGIALIFTSLGRSSSGSHVPSFRADLTLLSFGAMLSMLGPPIGVAISGHATGGTGSVGYTFLGALCGAFLSVPGIVIGSIVGYRVSADDEPATDQATLMPILNRYEIGLQWSGALDL